jgi:hypothetical protein
VIALLIWLAPLFPWDRPAESVLGHHHLIAAYCFTWGLQLAYLGYVAWKWLALGRTKHQPPTE